MGESVSGTLLHRRDPAETQVTGSVCGSLRSERNFGRRPGLGIRGRDGQIRIPDGVMPPIGNWSARTSIEELLAGTAPAVVSSCKPSRRTRTAPRKRSPGPGGRHPERVPADGSALRCPGRSREGGRVPVRRRRRHHRIRGPVGPARRGRSRWSRTRSRSRSTRWPGSAELRGIRRPPIRPIHGLLGLR